MNLSHFTSLTLILTICWMQLYAAVREIHNGVGEYQVRLEKAREEIKRTKLQLRLEQEHFFEFRQHVATLMPEVLQRKGQGEKGYPYRSLASTVTKIDATEIRMTIAKTLFEKGKDYYRKGEFARAQRAFKQLIDRFGFSPHVVESYFLLAESHFRANELEDSVAVIEEMIELFPGHELTGFAMIRLGRIYQMRNRAEEAVEIFRTVLRTFPQRDVASQARASMRGMDL